MRAMPEASAKKDDGRVSILGWKCSRCAYEWVARPVNNPEPPIQCPNCRTAYWRRPRAERKPESTDGA